MNVLQIFPLCERRISAGTDNWQSFAIIAVKVLPDNVLVVNQRLLLRLLLLPLPFRCQQPDDDDSPVLQPNAVPTEAGSKPSLARH